MENLPPEAAHGNNGLTLGGKLTLFTCKHSSTKKGNTRSELKCRSFVYKPELNEFLDAGDASAVLSSSVVDIIKCQCAMDVQKRVTTPCVLVAKKGKNFGYCLLTLSPSNLLETCMEFQLPYEMNGGVFILQGPTVVWTHAGCVFYTSSQTGEVRQVPLQLTHSIIGELPLHKGRIFVVGLQSDKKQLTSRMPGYFLENRHTFDGNMLLPHPYMCITKCVLVLSADLVDDVLTSAVVAVMSNQQLVYFENGVVKDTRRLPFEQPEAIQVVNTGRNGTLFLVSFHQGHVCVVWKDTFEIASQWSDVSSVHVDDFLGCGTDQMLMFFKEEGARGQPLDKFMITDLCGISYSRGLASAASETSPPQSENYLLTLRALQSRLQSGLTVLQELQREVSLKELLLQQSVRVLSDTLAEKEPNLTQHEQEGLIALWDCDDDDDVSEEEEVLDNKTHDVPAASSKPQVTKLWHRTADDRMVVGVILTTDSSIPAASMSLSILTETGQSSAPAVIHTQSQVFWLPPLSPSSSSSSSSSFSPSTFQEPAAKRSKHQKAGSPNALNTCRLAVTAVTRLTPLLNSGCVKCRVMLHYVHMQDASALPSNPAPVILHCGQVTLNIHQDFKTQLLQNPELKTDEAQEDLLGVLAMLDHWVLCIDSPDHSLGDIEGLIKKDWGCQRVQVNPQYLLLNSSGPSAVTLLHWHQISPFQAELSVHSSQLQTLQLLDSLLGLLPASCSVRSVKGTRGQEAAQVFSSALEKEVVALRELASSLLSGEQEEEGDERRWRRRGGHEETPDAGSLEGLQTWRDLWQQDVDRSRRILSPLLDVGRYRRLTQGLSRVQLDVDLAALEETLLS